MELVQLQWRGQHAQALSRLPELEALRDTFLSQLDQLAQTGQTG